MNKRLFKKRVLCGAAAMLLTGSSFSVFVSAEPRVDRLTRVAAIVEADSQVLDRGRYLAKTAGCNDCHTPGYAQSAGQVDEAQWLTGDSLGWQGPWGTTYPINLRLFMKDLNADQWLKIARSPARPPMPWFALRDMTDEDLLAIYHYVRSLGPAGLPAPSYLPPGQQPQTAVIKAPGA